MLKPSERNQARVLQDKVISRLKIQGHNDDGEIIFKRGELAITLRDLKHMIYPELKLTFEDYLT